METKFKAYSQEDVKQIFKDYKTHTFMVNSENELISFEFENYLASGSCELIAGDEESYWNISCGSKHYFRGGNNHYLTLEDCLKFANHMY
jgi:hypothetical protein